MQKHRELLQQAYHWSAIDRRKSDELYAQAAELETQITATI